MKETRPILLIQINTPNPTTNEIWSNDSKGERTFQEKMQIKFYDYHVLCFNGFDKYSPQHQIQIELKVYNHENVNNIQFEELKDIIKGVLDANTGI